MSSWSPTDKYGVGGDDRRPYDGPTAEERRDARDEGAEDERATQLAALKASMGAAQEAALAAELAYIDAASICRETPAPLEPGRERDDRFDALGNDLDAPLDPAEFEGHEDYDDECWASPDDLAAVPAWYDPTAPCDFDSSSPRDLF